MPIFESADDILRKYEQGQNFDSGITPFDERKQRQNFDEKHALQPLSPDVPQAQTGVQEGGLQDAFDDTPIPRVKLQHKYNKPEQQGTINPYGEGGLTGRQLSNLRRSFVEDNPLLCIEDDETRKKVESIAATFGAEDGERIRKAVALAHYYSMGHRDQVGEIFNNLDVAIELFEGKKMTVDQAFESVKRLYEPQQEGIWGNRMVAAATAGGAEVDKTAANAVSFIGRRLTESGQIVAITGAGLYSGLLRLIGAEGKAARVWESAKDSLLSRDYGKEWEDAVQTELAKPIETVETWAQQNMKVPENWVTDSESVSDWVENAGLSLLNYMPQLGAQLTLMTATGGVSSLGLVYGINGYYDIKGDLPEISEEKALLYGLGIGLINGALENVSLGIVEGKVAEHFASNGIKKGMTRILEYLGASALMEGSEEALEEFSENMLDIYMGRRGDTKDWTSKDWTDNLFRGMPEAFFLGFTTGFGMAGLNVKPLREKAELNQKVRNYAEKRKSDLDAKETLTNDEELEYNVLSAALDSNDPNRVLHAANVVSLNAKLRQQQEQNAAQKRYNEAEERFSKAQEELDAISARPTQDAKNRNTAVTKYRAAKAELDAAKADLDAARKDFVKAFPEEETIEERAIREAEEVRIARDLKRRIGWNPQDTIDTVNQIAQQYQAIPIHAVLTFDDLPENAKEEARRRGIESGNVEAVWCDNEVYVVADKLRPGMVGKKILHEVVGHEGLRRIFGDQYNGFLDDVFAQHSAEIEEMGLAKLYNTQPDTEEGRRYLADEYLAKLAESDVKPSWWKELLAQIRTYLRNVFSGIHFSDADIEAALARSARAMRREQELSDVAPESRFALGGEMGASRLNNQNYNIAIEMEEAGKDAKSIWLATGWERGKDGRWRFELPDMKVKLNILNTEELNEKQGWYLWDFAEGRELFEAYPELKDIIVRIEELSPLTGGHYDPNNNEIVLNRYGLIDTSMTVLKWREDDVAALAGLAPSDANEIQEANAQLSAIRKGLADIINDTLVHEVQHAIQEIEGFAKGTNPTEAAQIDRTQDMAYIHQKGWRDSFDREIQNAEKILQQGGVPAEIAQKMVNLLKEFMQGDNWTAHDLDYFVDNLIQNSLLEPLDSDTTDRFFETVKRLRKANESINRLETAMSPIETYKRFAGETESRNVQLRADMDDERRRKTPPSQTEDTPRYYQIVRFSVAETGEDVRFSIRQEPPPKKTLKGYKVFAVFKNKPGLYPPMVANPGGEATPVAVWLNADAAPRAEDSKTGRPRVQAGGKGTNVGKQTLAFRPGWHLGEVPVANQFMRTNPETGKKDLFPDNFVWAECEIAADVDYQEEAMSYGKKENGKFQHSLAGLPRVPKDGFYRYRTNPDPNTDPWLITGAMKVTRLLDDADVEAILKENGREPYKRQGGPIDLSAFGLKKGDTRFSVSPVWTGSAADYEQPDLNYVGTGEGAQVYGWGLYGSNSRSVGEWYANNDVKRKHGPVLTFRGADITHTVDAEVVSRRAFGQDEQGERLRQALRRVADYASYYPNNPLSEIVNIAKRYPPYGFTVGAEWNNAVDEVAKDMVLNQDYAQKNLYKQTFWPDKEENLLDWDNLISVEQAEQVQQQAEKEHLFDELPEDENELATFARRTDRTYNLVYLHTYLAPKNEKVYLVGSSLYYALERVFQSPKEASEFLLRAGIDGITYIGNTSHVRNYVAFSDKDIRVEEHIRFSVAGADNNLIAVHNVTEQKLRDAIKLGALPVPSLGIIDAEKSDFTDYGKITLVADKDLIDPKRPKNKVFNSDIYSPRRPEIKRKFSEAEYDRVLEVAGKYDVSPDERDSVAKIVKDHRDGVTYYDFIDDLKNSPSVKRWYVDTKQEDEGFDDWWQRVAEPELDLHPDERIFDGYTASGNRRYLPANLETIVKIMTRKLQGGEDFFYGVGNIRANMAKQFKSIADIQKNRDKIVSGEEYKAIKEEITEEFDELLDNISASITGDRVSHSIDTAADLLRTFAEGTRKKENRDWLIQALGYDNPVYQDMADFLAKLKNLPSPLFEAKPQRAVYLDEFKAAVVPDNTSRDILRALEEAGVEIFTYEHDNEAARKATLQMVTKERNLRFSLENYSEEDKQQLVTLLKPKWIEEAFVEPSEVKAFLESVGETGIDENDAWALYHMAGSEIRAEKKKADDKKRDNWLYENDLLYHDAVDYGGLDFKIIPSLRFLDNDEWPGTFIADSWRKRGKKRQQGKNESGLRYHEYLRRREEELTSEHQTGITSDDLAKYIARIRGGDELDIEEQIIEHFRYMNRPKLWAQYYDYKKEQNYRNKIEQNEAEEEFAEFQREQIQQKVDEIIANKGQISEEWAIANPDVFKELYRQLMNEEPPKSRKPSKENLEAINARLANEDVNAAAYKAARKAAWAEFQKKLTALRQEMNDKNANAVKLQREAAAFAEENLPPELRGMFTRGIIKLLDYGTSPSKNFPEGRRMHEFYQLQDEILKASQTKRTEDSIGHIREMLDAVKMRRNWKGIPVSVIPSEQARVERIRKIIDMSAASVANAIEFNNARILELESGVDASFEKNGEAVDISAEKDKLVEDNALLELFGNLEYRKPDSVLKAEDFLQDLIKGGKAKFKSLLAQQAGRVMVMRQQAVSEITGGKNVTTTGGAVESKDAKNHTQYILKNMSLGSLLRLVAAKAGIDFDSTVAGKLWISTEKSTQKEMTANRHLQEDFDAELNDILGTSGQGKMAQMRKKGRFLKGLSKVEQKTGVFKTQFSRQKVIDPLDAPIVQVGRSSSKIHLIPVEDYTRRVQNEDGTFEEIKCPGVRSILRAIDNGGAYEIGDGVNLDETGVWMLRKQLEDYDAGIDRRLDFFKDEIDNESAKKLEEDSEKDKLAVIFRGKNVESKKVEVPLSQGTALQILLTWEQEDYRANMKWNGWSEDSIEQIKKFLKPETLQLGYWMRDYFAKQRGELDEAVVKRYGAHLPENQNYWPGRFSGSRTSIGVGGMRGAGTMSINPSFLIARKFHLNPLDMDVDAFSVFFDGQITQNHFLAWTDTIRDMREVFGDTSVQDAINENFGKEVTRNLVERIVTIAQGGSNNGFMSSFFSHLNRYWVPAKIALNPSSFIKQRFATLSYMNFMPVDEYVKYMSRANTSNTDYKAFVQMALNSDYLKNRWAGGLDKDLIYMMQNTRDTVPYSPLAESLLSVATYMTKHSDRWSALHGGFAVYQYNLDQARKSGLSEKEAQERARRAWMRATDSSQQSGYLKDLNYYQQNQGLVRFYTAFLTSPIQVMNLQLQTMNDIKYNSDNAAAKKKLAKQIFVNHVVVMTLMQFTTDMVRAGLNPGDWWDDAEFEDYFTAWLFGPFEGLFFVGKEAKSAINLIADKIFGRKNKMAQQTSAVQLASETEQNLYRVWNDLKDEEITAKDIADGMSFAGDLGMLYGATPAPGAAAVGSTGAVVNAGGTLAKRILKAVEDDEDGKKKTPKRRSGGGKRR